MEKDNYIPGDCNIGTVEIARRKTMGWISAAIAAILWALFILFHVPAPWRLLLFLPVSLSASGFLQAAMHFCAGFGIQGVFNFGNELYKTKHVRNDEFKAKDRKKALQIIFYSISIGIIVALIAALFNVHLP